MDQTIEAILRTLTGQANSMFHSLKEGRLYDAYVFNTGMAKDEFINLAFKTPTGCNVCMKFDACTINYANIKVYEDADWSGGNCEATTTQKTPINRNRVLSASFPSLMEDQYASSGVFAPGHMTANVSGLTGLEINDIHLYSEFSVNTEACSTIMSLKTGTLYGIELISDINGNGAALHLLWQEISGDLYVA